MEPRIRRMNPELHLVKYRRFTVRDSLKSAAFHRILRSSLLSTSIDNDVAEKPNASVLRERFE